MLLSFQYAKSCRRSHILMLHACQEEASNILVILILKLICVQEYIFDQHTNFEPYASKNVRLVTLWYKDITATSVCSETMMTLSRRILSQRNLIYAANIFVSASLWFIKNQSFTTLASCTICSTVKICQINWLRGC